MNSPTNLLSNKAARTLLLLLVLPLAGGCRHGIEISGQGRVTSASGARDCPANQSPCRFTVEGAYQETFTAIPASGWLHDAWERCQSPSRNQCSFSIAADVVADFADADIPGAIARFRLPIQPTFRDAQGAFVLLPGSATDQLAWLLGELRQDLTSLNEIRDHFSSEFLSSTPAAQVQEQINSLRQAVDDPEISDLIGATSFFTRAVVHNRGANSNGFFVNVSSDQVNGGLITAFSTTLGFPRGGSNVAAGEVGATLDQLAATVGEAAARTSMLVARIDNDRCLPLLDKEAGIPRPTGSIFKLWVLGALAEEIRAGRISPSAMVPFTSDEAVPGSALNTTAPGTQISVRDLANLMLGISDNTSTDLLLELVGRNRAEQILRTFGNRNRELMTPFLKVNEQFHVFWSLSPSLAAEYASAGDEEQRAILTNSIEPLGPVTAFPQSNQVALYDSSWTASAYDVCQAYAGLRKFDNRSDEFEIIEESAGAEVALLSVRNRWDRVWQKGGSLANNDGNYVFTLSWMFESDAKGTFVVVIMASNRDGTPVDSSSLFSLAARAEQIVFNR